MEIAAVCPNPIELDQYAYDEIKKIAEKNKLRFCEISEILLLDIDIGLSVNYYKKIREDILCHCRNGFYNVHHSYNLRLRGRNITTHAIINTLTENIFYHGTSLHKMVPELDAGPIVASRAIEISCKDTAYSLFQKADKQAMSMIIEWLPRLSAQKVFLYEPPIEGVHYYKNMDLPSRLLDINKMSTKELDVYIRAFDFPDKEPAFIEINGKKIHLVIDKRGKYIHQYNLNGCIYFTDKV